MCCRTSDADSRPDRAEGGTAGPLGLRTQAGRGEAGDGKAAFESPSGLCAPQGTPGQVWTHSLAEGAAVGGGGLTRGREDRERRVWFWWHVHNPPSLKGFPQPCARAFGHHRLGSDGTPPLSPGGFKSKVKVPAELASREAPLPGLQAVVSSLCAPYAVPSLARKRPSPWGLSL